MIQRISAEETYPVRQQVLRPGRPLRECFFEGDLEKDSFHLGYFYEGSLAGVATYVARKNDFFEASLQFQLRGMAVLPQFRNKNIGEKLLQEGENLLCQTKTSILWFNAREVAVEFYKKYGYHTVGEAFMIPNVCMHIVMYKNLQEK